jgi:hypothetical protein
VSLTVNIDAGVTIASSSVTTPAFKVGNFASGSSITINNAGSIIGKGGNGGDKVGYGTYLGGCGGVGNGQDGGNALELNGNGVVINNTGTIAGGGGGGGGGADLSITLCTLDIRPGNGGGGGAGVTPGTGGASGGSYPSNNGASGTTTLGGAGGAQYQWGPCFLSFGSTYKTGKGGDGGALGQPGQNGGNANGPIGSSGTCGAGVGGAAGCPIKTNSNAYTLTGAAVIGTVCP